MQLQWNLGIIFFYRITVAYLIEEEELMTLPAASPVSIFYELMHLCNTIKVKCHLEKKRKIPDGARAYTISLALIEGKSGPLVFTEVLPFWILFGTWPQTTAALTH